MYKSTTCSLSQGWVRVVGGVDVGRTVFVARKAKKESHISIDGPSQQCRFWTCDSYLSKLKLNEVDVKISLTSINVPVCYEFPRFMVLCMCFLNVVVCVVLYFV